MSTTILVGIDVETVNHAHAICEFAAIGIELATGTRVFGIATHIDPGDVTWDSRISSVHGITKADVFGKRRFESVWRDLETWLTCGHTVRLVAHNAAFDRTAIARAVGDSRVPPIECTYERARKALPLPNHKLATVCMALDIPLVNAHRAADDAAAAAELARRLELGHTAISPDRLAKVVGMCTAAAASPGSHAYEGNDARGKNWEVMQSTAAIGDALSGKKVCITGKFACGWSKVDGKRLIAKHGGQPMDNVSRQCDLLVMAGRTGPLQDEDYTSEKARKAKAFGVRVIGESEFRALVGE